MELQWFGKNCFLIKGDEATVLIDPTKEVAKKLPKEVDIVIRTNSDDAKFDASKVENKHLFDWPGAYEAKGVAVSIFTTNMFENDFQVVDILIDGFRISNLGYLNEELSNELSESLGDVDILMVPAGGGDVLDAKKAHEVTEMIEPKVIVLSCVEDEGAAYVKEAGIKLEETQGKLKFKTTAALPVDKNEYHVLKAS